MSKPSANLVAARNKLIEDGWTQGRFHDHETGAHCALGALEAVGVLRSPDHESQYLAEAIRETGLVTGGRFGTYDADFVEVYNDDVAEGLNDVLAVYDRAIILAKEREA